ncbi:MAG: hypothetical protein R8G34_02550 [Paracoccaceae bacterium]|nr:hypothetical protein [Paracoccaceae bacterium]
MPHAAAHKGHFPEQSKRLIDKHLEKTDVSLDHFRALTNQNPGRQKRALQKHETALYKLFEEHRRKRALALIVHSNLPQKEIGAPVGITKEQGFSRKCRAFTGQIVPDNEQQHGELDLLWLLLDDFSNVAVLWQWKPRERARSIIGP